MTESRKVYLDYSATTPVRDEVLKEMLPYFTEHFGNASSLYTIGLESKAAIDKAREQVANLIGASPKEIYFTGGGSESDNWVLESIANDMKSKGKGNHIITSRIEHHAVLHTCQFLEKNGYEVTYLDVEKDGTVTPEALEKAIRDDTVLISIMYINNEIGTIEPIRELAEVAHKHGILFHTDAVQAVGNTPIDVKAAGIDMLSMSSHKIYGPKGEGALYVRRGVRIPSFIHGGAQEMGKRAGTENLAGIVGFGKAAELAKQNLENHVRHCSELRDYLVQQIMEKIPDVYLNGPADMSRRHPGNANITFEYIEGESILLLLDSFGIAVSTGSACSSKSLEPSHVLSAIGVPDEMIHGTIRFTVGDFTTKEDIDYTVECLVKVVERLREISSVNSQKGWN
ncbi:cysteine desulfurase NifS [Hornefia butyriciproducens]|jgi:cysteine desulfurase|uniref:Cysteine desulfurase IscS n=1 Tax=Hornefia butyriciproducens TaxID=2652293 RepID=A0A6L5Y863_9FIRM|nr:cysteine desulfurase NifS [Hornefia butyriciproducens]MCI7327592.1 cysteine desulfurase NifS [Clostridiales bacterium]MCI7413961.1 cysteine desulfurase NifS [Clostridiales bacterium]MCI7680496.1 cysteine desulfurase NifS [Clostridiales bacterium]MDD6299335.1 cysteine desulfurase NifS [Hornefia butyriciproducens]MDD7019081.1 cysteine desulfurase NifS [Hornefia butyriciproducens]